MRCTLGEDSNFSVGYFLPSFHHSSTNALIPSIRRPTKHPFTHLSTFAHTFTYPCNPTCAPTKNPSVHLSTHPSPSQAYLPIVPRTHLSIYFLIHPSTIHSYTHPFIHSSIHPTIYSSIHLSIHQSNRHHFLFFH